MKHLTEFTIDRKIWGRGNDGGELHKAADGKMCCVGIYLEACGVSKDTLTGEAVAHDLDEPLVRSLPSWMDTQLFHEKECSGTIDSSWNQCLECLAEVEYGAPDCLEKLYQVNDDEKLTEADREEKIRALFKGAGVKVEFTG